MGVYNTSMAFGLFVGSALGGWLAHRVGQNAVFVLGAALSAVWLVLALSMRTPPAVRTRMYHLDIMDAAQARALTQKLAGVRGVFEAAVVAGEGTLILKVNMAGWDEEAVLQLIEGGV